MKYARLLLPALLAAVDTIAFAQSKPIPDPLKAWETWATWGDEDRSCPTPYSDAKKHLCFWPSRLGLQVEANGGKFDVAVTVFHETWVPLPGNQDTWPLEVKGNGAALAVIEHEGNPAVRLGAGVFHLAGTYRWSAVPQRIPVPKEIGILALVIDGKPVDAPVWDAQGFLWLKRNGSTEEVDKDFLDVKLYAALEDGIPLWLRTEVELTVAGKSREEEIGTVLPEGWKASAVESEIPAVVDDGGRMKAQVRAGKWTVTVSAFRFDNPKETRYAAGAKPAVAEELVAFRAKPDFRTVEIAGAPSIDVSQTTFPDQWRELPVYRWDTATPFTIEERMRGMGEHKAAGLTINREVWLDEDGRGFTFRDRISGAMQQIWRLDAAEGQDLGSVRSAGQGQLITRNPQTGAPGVEIRTRNLRLEATGRSARAHALSATGWRSDADGVRVILNLPPGWRLFALFGADWVRGDWLTAWTLLDLFLLLIFTLAVFRLWGFRAALLAFAGFGLAFHEPGAPRYLWLILLVPLALLRVVPAGWGRRFVAVGKWVSVVALLLCLVPFVAQQVKQALYPQLEIVSTVGPSSYPSLAEPTTETPDFAAAGPASSPDSAGTSRVESKLQRIIIPKLEFRDATIREAVEFLKRKSIELDTTETDPERKGVNIVLKLDDHGGGVSPNDARISVSLTNIPLVEALKYVTSLANLKFKIEPYAVAIVAQNVDITVLSTRQWKVRPGYFARASNEGGSALSGKVDAKEFLKSVGVTFPGDASATYLASGSRLVVHNTPENLDLIDTLVQNDEPSAPAVQAMPGLEPLPGTGPADASASRYSTVTSAKRFGSSDNLAYDAKARIQTGPGVPVWEWRAVGFGWNGPVSASQQVHPVLISLGLERVLTVLRVALLLTLAGVLLGARKMGGSVFRASGKAAAAMALMATLVNASAQAPIPDQATLDKLRDRLLETSDAYPHAADIPSVSLALSERKLTIDAEIHAAVRTAVPLPGKLPAWSPLSVLVDDKPEVALRRDDGYLWVLLDAGVHGVHVEGSLANLTEWEWTFLLKPRQVKIDAPGWTITGVKPDGVPEAQVFFALKEKAAGGAATYDRQEVQTIAVIDRSIELGLIWEVRSTVTRLSPPGKAVALRVPLLPGENVLSSNAIVKDGFIEVRLGAQEESFAWESGLTVGSTLKLATRAGDGWVEHWSLVASPVWNVSIAGLAPVFDARNGDLVPTWQPWPGESVDLAISRPEAMAGATVTVSRGTHEISLGRRQRTSSLELGLRCSLGEDFLIGLPADAEVTALMQNGKAIPVRKDGGKLIVPVHPGEQTVNIGWKTNVALGVHAQAGEVRLPVESANIQTTINVPEDRWVLWAYGPQRGPAVRFWGILICSLLAALVLGRIARSPIRTIEWMLLVIGLTQVPLPAALGVVAWLFFLAWRRSASFQGLGNISYNLCQVLLIGLTVGALGILVTAVGEGLLGQPEMFIIGNDSTSNALRWFQARSENALPRPGCVSVSIWWYRFFMLMWALWLATALIRWLCAGWQSFSDGGFFRRKPRTKSTPPPPLPAQG